MKIKINLKKITCLTAAAMITVSSAASVAATGWNSDKTMYETSDGSYATGLKTIGGLKYRFDNDGKLIGLYTGWARSTSTGTRNYYNNGKRCAGWRTIGGKKYYFYYEGGAATGKVQIEDKIYIFDDNGAFTGKTEEPFVYTKNVDTELYADNLPDKIPVCLYYTRKTSTYFQYEKSAPMCSPEEEGYSRIEKYENGKWTEFKDKNIFPDDGLDYGVSLVGRAGPEGYIWGDDNPDELAEDMSYVETMYYDMTAGKYRVVYTLTATQEGEENGFEDTEIYSYFTVK